jgi:coenzyme F420-0:L-glutamate ligase/coenzyme F420-1:gamma-L-glutamate ligase
MTATASLSVNLLHGLPLFTPGMDLAREMLAAASRNGVAISSRDVVVVAQKVVSKVEGRIVDLGQVEIAPEGRQLAAATGRAEALAQLVLDESRCVMRATPQAIITRHRTGHVTTNSGIDASNVAAGNVASGEGEAVLLWPFDPDASARSIRANLLQQGGEAPAVIIADSLGRAWRQGTLGTAIGCAGIVPTDDRRGQADLFGRTLQATVVAIADPLAAMGVLAMGEGAEGTPVAIIHGAARWITDEDGPGAVSIMRPVEGDLFL